MIPGGESHVEEHRVALAAFFRRQGAVIVPAAVEGLARIAAVFDGPAFDGALSDVVLASARRTVQAFASEIADRYGRTFEIDGDLLDELTGYARLKARSVNITTRDQLLGAVEPPEIATGDDRRQVAGALVANLVTVRALVLAGSAVTTEANQGRHEAAAFAGVARKRWVVTSSNPRATHAALNGQVVEMGSAFSNGARWPGDPILPVAERANCRCMVEFETATQ